MPTPDTIRGASSNPASQLSPPTLHWGLNGPNPDTCDLCSATIKPHGDCFISIRRSFELIHGAMIESEPIRVLMCVDCGWTRPYSPVPRQQPDSALEAPKPPETALQAPRGASERVL